MFIDRFRRMDGWMDGLIGEWRKDGSMEWMDGWMDACMDERTDRKIITVEPRV